MDARFDDIPYRDLSPEPSWTRLGQGSFGSVWKGEYLGLEVAIKEVAPSSEYDVDKYFRRECAILRESRHPNILLYLGLCLAPPAPKEMLPTLEFQRPAYASKTVSNQPRILIISEYVPRGNVRSFIHYKHLPFPWRLRVSFAVDLSRAIAYLHARRCMHRDLKGENLLVTENERIKICDFGFARLAAANQEEMRRMSYCGSDATMAPEIIKGDEFGLPADIFSCGVIFCEIISRKLAGDEYFKRTMPTFGISSNEIRALASSGCPADFLQLSIDCVAEDPAKRPKIRDVLLRLAAIEKEVLLAEAGDIADESSAGTLGHGTLGWKSVGSISFSGTLKRGSLSSLAVAHGRSSRPVAPRLPSFQGKVVVGGHTRHQDDSDDDDVAMLALADVQVDPLELADKMHEQQREVVVVNPPENEQEDFPTGSIVIRKSGIVAKKDASIISTASEITIRDFAAGFPAVPATGGGGGAGEMPGQWKKEFVTSGSTLPSAAAVDDSASSEEDPMPVTPPPEADIDASDSKYATAKTISTSRATVGVLDSDLEEDADRLPRDQPRLVFPSSPAKDAAPIISDEDVKAAAKEIPKSLVHRFSLVKPGWAFLASGAKSHIVPSSKDKSERKRTLSLQDKPAAGAGASEHKARRTTFEEAVQLFFGAKGAKCSLCAKKFSPLKPFLECDDCGYRSHVKCSDACPATCGSDNLDLTPLSDALAKSSSSSSNRSSSSSLVPPSLPGSSASSTGGSKLQKKRPSAKKMGSR